MLIVYPQLFESFTVTVEEVHIHFLTAQLHTVRIQADNLLESNSFLISVNSR
jgi:hypothetical protein